MQARDICPPPPPSSPRVEEEAIITFPSPFSSSRASFERCPRNLFAFCLPDPRGSEGHGVNTMSARDTPGRFEVVSGGRMGGGRARDCINIGRVTVYEFLYYTKIINLFGSIWKGGIRVARRGEGRGVGAVVGKLEGVGRVVVEERGSSRRGVCPKLGGGSRIEHASTHTLHSLGTRPLFMLDIIPLSKHTHFSRSLNVCTPAHTSSWGDEGGRGLLYRFSFSVYHEHDNTILRTSIPERSLRTRGKRDPRAETTGPVIDFNESRRRDDLIESRFKKKTQSSVKGGSSTVFTWIGGLLFFRRFFRGGW